MGLSGPGIFWDTREPIPPSYPRRTPFSNPDPTTAGFSWRHEVQQQNSPRVSTQNVLPPLSSSLIAQVIHDTAKVSVTQLFHNRTNDSIRKGAYTFPLPVDCTVTEFSCRVGTNSVVRAKIGTKSAARQAFNESVDSDQTASLLEQNTSEVFTTILGNIPANTRLKTEISFITVLKHKFVDSQSTTTLTIPTYIAPRYGPTPAGVSHGTTIETPRSFSAQVEVLATEQIRTISSTTHSITVNMGVGASTTETWDEFVTAAAVPVANRAVVRLANEHSLLEKDFVLEIMTQPVVGMEVPQALLEAHPSFEAHQALMLTIPPKFMLQNVASSHDAEIIFVADRSGSMEDKMQALKSAMNFFLRGIPSGRRFNIWCFGTNHTYLWPRSEAYSEANMRRALEYVSQNFNADMGGTELLPALKAIVASRGGMMMADIIVLTDGQVWSLDEVIKFVQQTRRSTEGRVRFFALGIGDAVSHELVEGIAKAGGGYAEVIPTAVEGGFEDRLLAMLLASLTGHVGPLQIELEGLSNQEAHNRGREFRETGDGTDSFPSHMPQEATQGNPGTEQLNRQIFRQSPADISTLSPFLRNRVYMLFDSVLLSPLPTIKIMTNTLDGDERVTRVEVKPLDTSGSTLHKLGARALLGDLERGQSWIQLEANAPLRGSPEEAERTRTEGEKLGCKWSLVSPWTSFYAIEELYEAEGAATDPFLDVDDAQIQQLDGDLGLLRPWGSIGQQLHSSATAALAGTAALLDEGSGEGSNGDEEDDSQSDQWEADHNGEDWDDERRNGSGDEGGGASGGGNQGTDGRQDYPDSSERQGSPAPDDGRQAETTSGRGNPQFSQRLSHILNINAASSVEVRGTLRVAYNHALLPQSPPPPRPLSNPYSGTSVTATRWKLLRKGRDSYTKSGLPAESSPLKKSKKDSGDFPVKRISLDDESSFKGRIDTPQSNLPASTSLLQTERRDALTTEEKEGRQMVQDLLVFQSSDGSFHFGKHGALDELDTLLGKVFVSFVENLVTVKVDVKSAATAAIVALLEEKFQFCEDLWVMMAKKAREYLLNTACLPDLISSATKKIKTVEIRLKNLSATKSDPATLLSVSPTPRLPTTLEFNSQFPTRSSLETGDESNSSGGDRPVKPRALDRFTASNLPIPLTPTASRPRTSIDQWMDLESDQEEEIQPTIKTSAPTRSSSQPPTTGTRGGLLGRRVVLDIAPVDDDDM